MMSKGIFILFGEMGVGKNYWGESLAKGYNYTFFDGDSVVPPEMIEKVVNFKPLTREMILNYVEVLIKEIDKRAKNEPNGLVVSQALYFDSDRINVIESLRKMGYKVKPYWVKARFWDNLKQIFSRPKGFRWVLYWLLNKPYFQKPTHWHCTIGKYEHEWTLGWVDTDRPHPGFGTDIMGAHTSQCDKCGMYQYEFDDWKGGGKYKGQPCKKKIR